ncbi:MAG: response regulator transcription factor [Myxococcota bacterium]|nr:response regulator transcription factor [Myxococcota bacterium]
MAARVILIEDEAATRTHLAGALQGAPGLELCGVGGSLRDGERLLEETPAEVLLTDLGLPDGSGLELVRLAARRGVLPLVITVFGDDAHVLEAIRAGAMGYLLKDQDAQAVLQSISEVLDGGSPISPAIARTLLADLRARQGPEPGDAPQLTEREREVLRGIVKGFTYAEIADILELSTHTVSTHVRKVYGKLAVNSRGEAVYEALQLGLVSADD